MAHLEHSRCRGHGFLTPGGRGTQVCAGGYPELAAALDALVDPETRGDPMWLNVGRPRYPKAKRLLVSADAGSSNGYRVRLWKWELAQLANETGLAITVCHFPPGTSKWNNRAPALRP